MHAALLAGPVLAYVVVLLVCYGDAVFPLLPSETTVLAGGVLCSQGRARVGTPARDGRYRDGRR